MDNNPADEEVFHETITVAPSQPLSPINNNNPGPLTTFINNISGISGFSRKRRAESTTHTDPLPQISQIHPHFLSTQHNTTNPSIITETRKPQALSDAQNRHATPIGSKKESSAGLV